MTDQKITYRGTTEQVDELEEMLRAALSYGPGQEPARGSTYIIMTSSDAEWAAEELRCCLTDFDTDEVLSRRDRGRVRSMENMRTKLIAAVQR